MGVIKISHLDYLNILIMAILAVTPDKNVVSLYHKRVIREIQEKTNKGLNLINFIINEDFDVNNIIPKNYRILERVKTFVEYGCYMLDYGFKYTIVRR